MSNNIYYGVKIMKNFTISIILMILLSSLVPAVAAPPEDKMVNVIIGFNNNHGDDVRSLVAAHGGNAGTAWKIIHAMPATLPLRAIEAIQKSPNVEYVELDGTVYAIGKPSTPPGKDKNKDPQPEQETPWGVDRIGANLAWSNSIGTRINVSVLDTGIDYSHPDLDVKGGVSVVGPRESTEPRDWNDKNGHGTHVAGTIAAMNNTIGVVGVAPNASLYAVKVLGNSGIGSYSDLIDGIQWSIDNNMQVISMSLSGTFDSIAVKSVCDAANTSGLILVAAAGNEGDGDNAISYPAAYDSVIAVGATNISDIAPSWSNSGTYLELAAPGVDIISTWTDESYNTISGTSMATPHVSGTVALILAANGSLSNIEVRNILQTNVIDLGEFGKDNVYGYGLIDADGAVADA
jgi:subtilisin family serine protease